MNKPEILAMSTAILFFQLNNTHACEEYNKYSLDDLKESRDVLKDPNADPLDQMFAFEKLICSENPNIRNYAIREGLENTTNSLIRNEILINAMMQKQRIDIELSRNGNLTEKDIEFFREHSGILSMEIDHVSEKEGIMCFSYGHCNQYIKISGENVHLKYNRIIGNFRLSKTNELVGFIRVDEDKKYSRIPAVIKLF